MKLERLLAIIVLLLNRGRVTAKELAEYFEVSPRTIYRDIETINQAGIPVVAYQGGNGGFGIMDTYKVDRHLLTPEEMGAIVTALRGVNTTLKDRKLTDIMEKMEGLIARGQKEELKQLDERLVIDFSPWVGSKLMRERVNLLKVAIEGEKLVQFEYTDAEGVLRERCIEPMTLVLKGYSWYLYGFCRMREDYRLFRLSRMKGLRCLNERFIRRVKGFEGFAWGEPVETRRLIELVMRFSPRVRVRVEDYFDAENIETAPDGTMLVRVRYHEDDWVYGMLLSYGNDVEVLEPPHLREIISRKAEEIVEVYREKNSDNPKCI